MADFGERRRFQRVDAHLRMKMYLGEAGEAGEHGTQTELETINISTSGVYFRTDSFLSPMTKLALGLELSVPGDDGPDLALVQCQGLVVRTQPEEQGPDGTDYEVVVFFTWIETEGQAILADHVDLLVADA